MPGVVGMSSCIRPSMSSSWKIRVTLCHPLRISEPQGALQELNEAACKIGGRVQIVSRPPDQILNSRFGAGGVRSADFDPGGHRGVTELRVGGPLGVRRIDSE